MSYTEEFYDDWRDTEVTHDYHSPLEAEMEGRLEQLERERDALMAQREEEQFQKEGLQ